MSGASFDAVVAANFDAVALLRCGHLEASASLLRKAAASIHLVTTIPEAHSQEKLIRGTDTSYNLVSVPVDETVPSTASAALQKSSSPVFVHGFLLQTAGATSAPPHTDKNAIVCASLCLYNMALVKHLQGLSSGASSCLQKAMCLYKKVFSVLSSLSPSPADHFCALLLATVINLIACESELCGENVETQEWRNIYNRMYHYIVSSKPAQEQEERLSTTTHLFENPEDLAFFTASAVFYANQTLTSAPAA